MNIAIIGTGYVGLVAGACLSDIGNNVINIDCDVEKTEQLKKGIVPIYEPGLSELVKLNIKEKRLSFSTDIADAVKKSSICFIAVGTPTKEDSSVDLKAVYKAAEDIAKAMNEYKIIVNKSTVPVGTIQNIKKIIKQNTKYDFDVVSNPEFLKQGSAIKDFTKPDRIIIGTDSNKAAKIMQQLYSPYLRTTNRIILMDAKSAEMSKYASNCFLAAKISFINEIALLCEKTGADIEMVRRAMATDTRIGDKFLFAGLGWGGSCFPKDIKALIKAGIDNNCEMPVIQAVEIVNKRQRQIFINKILKKYNNNLKNLTCAVWGLSYKPKTSDMREAPSITIINELLSQGVKIKAYDPKALKNAKEIFKNKITYSKTPYEALEGADFMILLTQWREFLHPDFNKMKNLLKTPIIFDGRNLYNPKQLKALGFEYICIGK